LSSDRSDDGDVTLAELDVLVIGAVEVTCRNCGVIWLATYDFLPFSTSLTTLANLFICPSCGGRELLLTPPGANKDDFAH